MKLWKLCKGMFITGILGAEIPFIINAFYCCILFGFFITSLSLIVDGIILMCYLHYKEEGTE